MSQPNNSLNVSQIPLGKIVPSADQPRKIFRPHKLEEIQQSIHEHGFTLSCLLVRPHPGGRRFVCSQIDDSELYAIGLDEPGDKFTSLETCGSREEAYARIEFLSDRYEVVDGEQRWRGAKAEGLSEVPCIIQDLTDSQVLLIQLTANGARGDLTAIEEGEGYARLIQMLDEQGEAYTAAKIAKAVGRPVRDVERRLQLRVLSGEARRALEEGILPASTALYIARIPDEAMREEAAREILHPTAVEAPMSERLAEIYVRQTFMRNLKGSPFSCDDAELVPAKHDPDSGERISGGACTDCPARLGNRPDLKVPKAQANICSSPACYDAKAAVGWGKWQRSETGPNRIALSEVECRELYTFGDQRSTNCGLVDLDECPDGRDLRAGIEPPGTWKSLIGDADVPVLVARDRDGKRHELVRRDLAIEAADTIGGHKIFKSSGPAKPSTAEDRAAATETRWEQIENSPPTSAVTAQEKPAPAPAVARPTICESAAALSVKVTTIEARMLRATMRQKLGSAGYPSAEFLRLVAKWLVNSHGVDAELCAGRVEKVNVASMKKWIAEMMPPTLVALIAEIISFPDGGAISGFGPQLAACWSIDLEQIRLEAEAEAGMPARVRLEAPAVTAEPTEEEPLEWPEMEQSQEDKMEWDEAVEGEFRVGFYFPSQERLQAELTVRREKEGEWLFFYWAQILPEDDQELIRTIERDFLDPLRFPSRLEAFAAGGLDLCQKVDAVPFRSDEGMMRLTRYYDVLRVAAEVAQPPVPAPEPPKRRGRPRKVAQEVAQ